MSEFEQRNDQRHEIRKEAAADQQRAITASLRREEKIESDRNKYGR